MNERNIFYYASKSCDLKNGTNCEQSYLDSHCVDCNFETGMNSEQSSHWTFHCARAISQANTLLNKIDFKVGIIYISPTTTESEVDQLSEFFYFHDNINWIILISPHQLTNPTDSHKTIQLILNLSYDFHTLPIDKERLLVTMGRAYGLSDLKKQSTIRIDETKGRFGMIGNSDVMKKIYQNISKISRVDSPVLISGETGAGKELVAKAIHNNSKRKDSPFVAVNCGTLTKELIHSELFGHEKGSFTGAHQQKIGKVQLAEGGTLFLDEIGDLPLDMQVDLLRFLQEGTICRVGGTQEFNIDVRVITATHVDLKMAIMEKTFREDLFYRLNVLNIHLPPLRGRVEDILDLTWYFFYKSKNNENRKPIGFSKNSLDIIRTYNWEGNVRELQHCIHRAVIMTDHNLITPDDLNLCRRKNSRCVCSLSDSRSIADTKAIRDALDFCNYHKTNAAKVLGISRDRLYKLMQKYDIDHSL